MECQNGDTLVFVGKETGRILDEEIEYQSNLVFPWLDNKSFNKWFQPDGVDFPFGALRYNARRRGRFS